MVGNIQSRSQTVTDSMSNTLSSVEQGVLLANEAGTAIDEIKLGANQVVDVVQSLSNSK